jgi:hypothetical protein
MTNIAIDTLVGSISIVGDAFDFAYKSNLRNLRIYEQSLYAGHPDTARHWGFFIAIVHGVAGRIRARRPCFPRAGRETHPFLVAGVADATAEGAWRGWRHGHGPPGLFLPPVKLIILVGISDKEVGSAHRGTHIRIVTGVGPAPSRLNTQTVTCSLLSAVSPAAGTRHDSSVRSRWRSGAR